MSTSIKSRFAPSPTGDMHLGNLRTALFNFLWAQKSSNGTFLLRIEDTDQSRDSAASLQGLLQVLTTLGMHWQEGPNQDKGNGPYRQSERSAIYEHYYQGLIAAGRAYPCYCTEAELAIARKTQLTAGKAPKYSGKCRELTVAECAAFEAKGQKPTLRFKVLATDEVHFTDLVKGPQSFKGVDLGDFIIRREDKSSTFLFCNAIDDALMKVTHALRGDDHLSNTPRQLLILKVLGLNGPQYGHLPLILGDDGAPLSKRNGSLSAETLLAQGFFPIAVLNYLTRLGHPLTETGLLSLPELVERFSFDHLSKSAARFDKAQLLHWQKLAVQQSAPHDLEKWLSGKIKTDWQLDAEQHAALLTLVQQNGVVYEDVEALLSTLLETVHYESDALQILKETDPSFLAVALESVSHFPDWKGMSEYIKGKTGKSGKALFAPLRAALTGMLHGPEMALVLRVMGKARVQSRLSPGVLAT